MFDFHRSLRFAAVPKSITYLLNQPVDVKEQLHRAINEGIETGLVCPINESNMMETSISIDK